METSIRQRRLSATRRGPPASKGAKEAEEDPDEERLARLSPLANTGRIGRTKAVVRLPDAIDESLLAKLLLGLDRDVVNVRHGLLGRLGAVQDLDTFVQIRLRHAVFEQHIEDVDAA